MNKRILYFFICTYFLMSIQLSTEIHFCKGNFISVSFNTPQKSCCKSKKNSKKCCKKYNLALKRSSQEEKINSISILSQCLQYKHPTIMSFDKQTVVYKESVDFGFNYKAPTPTIYSKLFISNCV